MNISFKLKRINTSIFIEKFISYRIILNSKRKIKKT